MTYSQIIKCKVKRYIILKSTRGGAVAIDISTIAYVQLTGYECLEGLGGGGETWRLDLIFHLMDNQSVSGYDICTFKRVQEGSKQSVELLRQYLEKMGGDPNAE